MHLFQQRLSTHHVKALRDLDRPYTAMRICQERAREKTHQRMAGCFDDVALPSLEAQVRVSNEKHEQEAQRRSARIVHHASALANYLFGVLSKRPEESDISGVNIMRPRLTLSTSTFSTSTPLPPTFSPLVPSPLPFSHRPTQTSQCGPATKAISSFFVTSPFSRLTGGG